MGADLLVETLQGLADGTIVPEKQDNAQASPCRFVASARANASGFHCSTVSALDMIQYGCKPPPEQTTMLGRGRPVALMKAAKATVASVRSL